MIAALAAGLALVVLLPGRAGAGKAPRVGIVVSVQVNLKKAEAQQLADAFGRALHQKLVVDVVAGAEANRRLPTEGVSESCVVDQVCLRDIAQRLTADELLFVVAARVGNRIQVDSTWVDPANGRSASRPKVVMVKLEEAEQRFADAASLILPDAAVRRAESEADVDNGSGGSPTAIVIRTTPRRMTLPAWITAGVGVVAMGGAVAYTLGARHDYKTCQDDPLCRDGGNMEFHDGIDRKALTADVLWAATGVSLVAVGILYWTSGGDIERVPVAAQALRFGVGPDGSAFVSLGGDL